MFRHNLLLFLRNIRRFKSSFFINLIGLSIGLSCTLLIFLWVNDELHFDRFHQKDNRLFQVMENQRDGGNIVTTTETTGILAQTLATDIPEVAYATATTSTAWFEKFTLSAGDNNLKAVGLFAGKDFFNVFSYDLLQGDKDRALADKNAIVISEDLARRLFNTTDGVIGKSIRFQHEKEYFVSGIFKGTPPNSSVQFDFILSFDVFREKYYPQAVNWDSYGPNTYVILREGAGLNAFNAKIAGIVSRKTNQTNRTLFARPYSDGYLFGRYENGRQAGGRIEYVRLFSLIALFILVIACINFMNLSTAKASRRMKEVGIKKAVGAGRKTLIIQFLVESMVMALLSLLIAVIIVLVFLPHFNSITGKHLSMHFGLNLILSLLGVTILTGLIAGSYPALYLSGFNPVIVLKGKLINSIGELWARKGLVVFQFSISIILIASVLVVYKQMEYIQTKNVGYNKDHIIYFEKEGAVESNPETFIAAVKNIPGILNVSEIGHSIIGSYGTTVDLSWDGKRPDDAVTFEEQPVGYGMIETLGITMKAGRPFSKNFGTDSSGIIFNEAAIEVMGLKDPVGKIVRHEGKDYTITGVVQNFNFQSLHENVKPLYFILAPSSTKVIMAKTDGKMERAALDKLQELYRSYNPGFTLDYKFLDVDYQAQYEAESRGAALSKYFAGLAAFISCIGLFGLAAFTAERKLKEIGIRKVLGAGNMHIIYLLSGEFTKLVLISILIALPVSYLAIKYWLSSFAYRIDLEWWYFALSGVLALFIAWLTVGMQAVKAAATSPVKCLKDS
jgi:putative ABC transport system permease protein